MTVVTLDEVRDAVVESGLFDVTGIVDDSVSYTAKGKGVHAACYNTTRCDNERVAPIVTSINDNGHVAHVYHVSLDEFRAFIKTVAF